MGCLHYLNVYLRVGRRRLLRIANQSDGAILALMWMYYVKVNDIRYRSQLIWIYTVLQRGDIIFKHYAQRPFITSNKVYLRHPEVQSVGQRQPEKSMSVVNNIKSCSILSHKINAPNRGPINNSVYIRVWLILTALKRLATRNGYLFA